MRTDKGPLGMYKPFKVIRIHKDKKTQKTQKGPEGHTEPLRNKHTQSSVKSFLFSFLKLAVFANSIWQRISYLGNFKDDQLIYIYWIQIEAMLAILTQFLSKYILSICYSKKPMAYIHTNHSETYGPIRTYIKPKVTKQNH